MSYQLILKYLLITLLCFNCRKNSTLKTKQNSSIVTFDITNLSDKEYPDNPDIGFRSKTYKSDFFKKGEMEQTKSSFHWNFSFFTKAGDTISFKDLNISEFIPKIPEHVKPNQYLSHISCINQEWNRNQVKFNTSEFKTSSAKITRVDIARNCLNAYLWEIIIYTKEGEKTLPYAHGWFDFPHDLYASLFEKKNKVEYSKFQKHLEQWVDQKNETLEMSYLRTIIDTLNIDYKDLSDEMYPLAGARIKKYKEIIYPYHFSTMRELQSDSTLFATFTPPGFYNKKDPRKTELGRIYDLQDIKTYKVKTKTSKDTLYEIQLSFLHKSNNTKTKLIIGGIDFKKFPILKKSEANKGWKNSMGISNHTFYETYSEQLSNTSEKSPYYAFLMDENGNWLDSHKIGIDGPIFHFSEGENKTLNLWLLSFERHALVGHYEIKLM